MAQVTIRINGYAYTVGCDDGQANGTGAERDLNCPPNLGLPENLNDGGCGGNNQSFRKAKPVDRDQDEKEVDG